MVIGFFAVALDASALQQTKEVNGIEVKVSSIKPLVVGENILWIDISKSGVVVDDLKILQIKIFMPKMTGMPYMESKANGELADSRYSVHLNMAMSGTWQYQIRFKDRDGKKYKVRGSFNL